MKTINIYSLLDIKPNSNKLLFILLPPIYSLWLLAIGKRLIGKQKKSDRFFSLITVLFFVLNVLQIIALPFFGIDFLIVHQLNFKIFGLFYFLLFFVSITIVTKLTVEYDRNKNRNKYYSIKDSEDYLKRFFSFIYWPFFIWTFQKTVNEFNN